MPLITLPTRITSTSKTLIDNILFNQFVPDIKSGNLNVSISDHTPQFSIIPFQNIKLKNKIKSKYIRNFKHSDATTVKGAFDAIDWELDDSQTTVNQDLLKFIDKSNKAINTLFPYKNLPINNLNKNPNLGFLTKFYMK